MTFTVKDSGKREEYESGMRRDTNEGKVRYDLVVPETMKEPMLKRWAEHMTKGANKYGDRNWEKAAGTDELRRFRESAFRHFMQWYMGETDEDHASAVFFNIQGAEYAKEKIEVPTVIAVNPLFTSEEMSRAWEIKKRWKQDDEEPPVVNSTLGGS